MKIHTQCDIPFSNPFIVRVTFDQYPYDSAKSKLGELSRKTFRLIKGTWGYTQMKVEKTGEEASQPVTIQGANGHVATFPGYMTPVLSSRSYFLFRDRADALQFMLYTENAKLLTMWPSNLKFTVYDYDDTQQKVE